MVVFERLVLAVMLALLIVAAIVIFIFYRGAGQVQSFTDVSSICESSFASACFNTGKAPATWSMPTQNIGGMQVSCSEVLNCTCHGMGSAGNYLCSQPQK